MNISATNYFYAFVIIMNLQAFGLTLEIGFFYTLFSIMALGVLQLYKKNTFYKTPLIFMGLAFFLAYMVRPFLLWDRPEFFEFIEVIDADHEAIRNAIWDVVRSFFFLLCGFVLVTKIFSFKNKLNIPASEKFLQEHFTALSVFGVFLSILKIFLFFVLGIGAKGVAITSPLAFVQRFIPEDLFFIVTIIAVIILKSQLTHFQRMMIISVSALLAFGIMVTGSKIFLMRLGFFYMAYMVYYDAKIPLTKFLILVTSGLILIQASFVMSSTMKYFNKSGLQITPVALAVEGWERYQKLDVAEINDMLTERMNGMDGQIVTTAIIRNPRKKKIGELRKVFGIKETFYRIVEGIVPGLAVSTTPSAGVAVSWYVYEFDKDFIFAGAVGFVGSMQFGSSPRQFPIDLFIYGACLGLLFGSMQWIRLDLLKFAVCALIAFHIVMVTISGNFDVIFSQLFIKLVLIPCYGVMFIFIRQIIKFY